MQKDLFGGVSTLTPASYTPEPAKKDFLQKQFSLRFDHALIAGVLVIVAYIFVFSFGVESGKRYASAEIRAERAMRERMAKELGEKIFANQQALQTSAPAIAAKPSLEPVSNLKKELPKPEALKAAVTAPKVAEKSAAKDVASQPKALPVTSGKGKFAVQTVTFTSKSIAQQQIELLLKKGYQGKIVPRGKFLQICVTGFETRLQARQAMEQLKNEGLAPKDSYIRSLA